MNQGAPVLGARLARADAAPFARALDLRDDDLYSLPMQVVSTGLPYLIVPVSQGLERARIVVEDFERRLASVGAKFVYVLDPEAREGRTWDNAARSRTSRPGAPPDRPRRIWRRTDSPGRTRRS
jgi:trans-2,3-dihydro-3-hydroxyanthranilate isomerase